MKKIDTRRGHDLELVSATLHDIYCVYARLRVSIPNTLFFRYIQVYAIASQP